MIITWDGKEAMELNDEGRAQIQKVKRRGRECVKC